MPVNTVYRAECDECKWKGNATEDEKAAQEQLDYHKSNDPKLGTDEPHDKVE